MGRMTIRPTTSEVMALRAFVSSTFEDLKDHRAHVITALRKAGILVDPMEDWSASADEPKTFSRARVKPCDLCVLLVAFRRGHVPEGEQESVTQLEYQAAVEAGIDVLVFMLKEDAAWRRQFDELDKDPALRRWRGQLRERKGVGFFDHRPDSVEIGPALSRWLQERVHSEAAHTAPVLRGVGAAAGAVVSAPRRRPYTASVLALLLLALYLALVRTQTGSSWPEALVHGAFLGPAGITLVVAIALVAMPGGHQRLVHSALVDALRRGRRAAITQTLAWHELSYVEGGVAHTTTVVAELAEVMRRHGIHAVVIPAPHGEGLGLNSRDQFGVDAAVSPVGLVLRAVVPLKDNEPALALVSRLERDVDALRRGPEHASMSIPLWRIADASVLTDMFLFKLAVPADWPANVHVTVVRLFLRHVLATALYRDSEPAGKAVVRAMMDLGDLLPPLHSTALGRMFMAAALMLAAGGSDLASVVRAMTQARHFAPNDSQLIALQTLLSLTQGSLDDAERLTGELAAVGKDKGLVHWLKADTLNLAKRHREAISEYEAALGEEQNPQFRGDLHFHVAFAYAMADDLPRRQQGDGMIRHLEDALQLGENPPLLALKGYGFALRGDDEKAKSMFDRALATSAGLPDKLRENTRNFVEHWRGRALRMLGQPEGAVQAVASTGITIDDTEDIPTLILLAGAALDQAGSPAKPEQLDIAEKYLNRVIKLDPAHAEAYKLRGTVHLQRTEDCAAAEARSTNAEAARADFLRAIRLGHEMPVMHLVLARLYEVDGDNANASKHRRRWRELAPKDPQAAAELALSILDETGRLQDAEAYLDKLADQQPTEAGRRAIAAVYRRLAVDAIGVAAPGTDVKESARNCLEKAIALGECDGPVFHLLATLHLEMAGDAFGSPEFKKAIECQRRAVELSPGDASGLTFLGIMHVHRGQHDEAATHFGRAAALDPGEAGMFEDQGGAWLKAGRLEDAVRAYRKALEIDSSRSTAACNLGFALFDLGDATGAFQSWGRALQSNPTEADAMAGQAAALHELGKDQEGFETYTRAVALCGDYLDPKTMATKYLWSARALAAVAGYLDRLRKGDKASV